MVRSSLAVTVSKARLHCVKTAEHTHGQKDTPQEVQCAANAMVVAEELALDRLHLCEVSTLNRHLITAVPRILK